MKQIDEATKYRIADLYQNTRKSAGAIADLLDVSRPTVNKYKNLKIPVQRRIV